MGGRSAPGPLGALVVACGLLAACQGSPSRPGPTFEERVLDFVRASQADDGGAYTEPPPSAVADLRRAVLALALGEVERAVPLLERNGYRAVDGAGGWLVLPERVPDGRGWGLYAVRPTGRPVVVEVPHPRADLRTEHLGAALAERLDAQHLLVAGARRDRGDGRADVSSQAASLFNGVHEALAEQGLPAVQLHGYAEDSSPGNDVVVSPGSARLSSLAVRTAEELDAAGFRTCRVWEEDCGPLAGRRNVQGAASATAGAAFVHLEVSRSVRDDRGRSAELVEAVARAVSATVPTGSGSG